MLDKFVQIEILGHFHRLTGFAWVVLILLNIVLLILGCFMETIAINAIDAKPADSIYAVTSYSRAHLCQKTAALQNMLLYLNSPRRLFTSRYPLVFPDEWRYSPVITVSKPPVGFVAERPLRGR